MSENHTIAIAKRDSAKFKILMPCLQVIHGAHPGKIFLLDQESNTMGRGSTCEIQVDETGVSRNHARILKMSDSEFVLEDLQSTNGTFVDGEQVSKHTLRDGDQIMMGELLTLKFDRKTPEELETAVKLFMGATRDGLTGLLNRVSFFDQVHQEHSLAKRQKTTFCLLMMDIDHFKKVNDTYGHPAGDAVLKSVASVLRSAIRTEDVLGRYGGEEFCFMLRALDAKSGSEMADRVRGLIEAHATDAPTQDGTIKLPVTASFGLAEWNGSETPEECLARADAALYLSKQGGRNRVTRSQG